ncbi:MAG: hypothetical protein ACRC41_12665 [Sarcina sp.]
MSTSGILGNSIDIHVGRNDNSAEIRADVRVDEFQSKRIWGQVVNCKNEPIPNTLVKLVRVVCQGNRKHYEGVAHTVSDCEGFYQFDVCDNGDNECYKIIINKAVTGQELVIDTQGGNCNSCSTNGCGNGNGNYNPCPPYNPVVKPYDPSDCECNNSCNANNCGCNSGHYQNSCGCNDVKFNDDTYQVNPCNNKPKTNYATYTR